MSKASSKMDPMCPYCIENARYYGELASLKADKNRLTVALRKATHALKEIIDWDLEDSEDQIERDKQVAIKALDEMIMP